MLVSTRSSMVLTTLLVLLAAGEVRADPPVSIPPGNDPIPTTFCLRVSDIADVGVNEFDFLFEVVHWGAGEVGGVEMAINVAGAGGGVLPLPSISGAGVDTNGRPIGPLNDDFNFAPVPPPPGAAFPGKVGLDNNFDPPSVFPALGYVRWLDAVAPFSRVPGRDLLAASAPGGILPCALIPTCVSNVIGNIEATDNGAPTTDSRPDNALDGFRLRIRDFEPRDCISVDWWYTTPTGVRLGTADGMGNQFSFGTFNLCRGMSGPPLVVRSPGAVQGPGSNVGATTGLRDMFQNTASQTGTIFSAEAGAGISVPFRNPQVAQVVEVVPPFNGMAIPPPPPVPLLSEGQTAAAGLLFLALGTVAIAWTRRRPRRRLDEATRRQDPN